MAPEVIRLHIDAFVNEFTLDAGLEGERALRSLLEAACPWKTNLSRTGGAVLELTS